jgi:uncharacterized protein (TIGR02145 family)
MIHCEKGHENPDGALFCKDCGRPFSVKKRSFIAKLWYRKRKLIIISASVLVLLIVSLIVISVYESNKSRRYWQEQEDERDFESVKIEGTISSVDYYLTSHPQGKYAGFLTSLRNAAVNPDYTQDSGYYADRRDGIIYKWVKIGSQIWMANNLIWNNQDRGSFYYEYRIDVAIPEGWKLPGIDDWRQLAEFVAGVDSSKINSVGKMLKSKQGWDVLGNGTDNFGFSVKPVGFCGTHYSNNEFEVQKRGQEAHFWTSTKIKDNAEPRRARIIFSYEQDGMLYDLSEYSDKYYACCIRCIKK